MNNTVLSIVIPTRNRVEYCKSTILAVKEIMNFDTELVVCDSSQDNNSIELSRFVNDLALDNIFYHKVSPDMNMTENFDYSIRLANGEFIIMIGDDDGVSPFVHDAVRYCQANNVESLTALKFYYEYNWPDYRNRKTGKKLSGKLIVDHTFSNEIKQISLDNAIDSFLSSAGQGCGILPRVYHGIISKSLRDKLIAKYSSCFFGVSPDVSFSLLAAVHSSKHCISHFPLSISGNSGKSNAGRSANGTHKGNLSDEPHLKNYINYYWPSIIPSFFSVETVWAQATLATLNVIADEKMSQKYSLEYLYSLMLLKHFDMRKQILIAAKNADCNLLEMYAMIFKIAFKKLMLKFIKRKPKITTVDAHDIFKSTIIVKSYRL